MSDIKTIREKMAAGGIRSSWVAMKAGISEPHFSNCMAGRRAFTDQVLAKIKKALKIK